MRVVARTRDGAIATHQIAFIPARALARDRPPPRRHGLAGERHCRNGHGRRVQAPDAADVRMPSREFTQMTHSWRRREAVWCRRPDRIVETAAKLKRGDTYRISYSSRPHLQPAPLNALLAGSHIEDALVRRWRTLLRATPTPTSPIASSGTAERARPHCEPERDSQQGPSRSFALAGPCFEGDVTPEIAATIRRAPEGREPERTLSIAVDLSAPSCLHIQPG